MAHPGGCGTQPVVFVVVAQQDLCHGQADQLGVGDRGGPAGPRAPATRSDLAGWAGYGHDTSHHCFYWGSRLLLVCTPEGR